MIKNLKVQRVHSTGDELIADAARASFDRQASSYTPEQNLRLLKFLAKADPPHWTPFGHVRVSAIVSISDIDGFKLMENPNLLAGMHLTRHGELTHSIWGWAALLREGVLLDPERVLRQLNCLKGLDAALYVLDLLRAPVGVPPQHSAARYSNQDVTLRITCPIVIARQLFKHTVGFVYSEASGRYILYDGQHLPEAWCSKPSNAKQGAGGPVGPVKSFLATTLTQASYAVSNGCNWLLRRALGIAPEQARYCMPMSTSTTFVVTASKDAWGRLLQQRLDSAAQQEIQALARKINTALSN